MFFKITGRRGGKTFAIIRLMQENEDSIMIQPSQMMADNVGREYPELRNRIFGSERLGRLNGRRVGMVHIDNLDLILRSLIPVGQRFGLVTATGLPFIDGIFETEGDF